MNINLQEILDHFPMDWKSNGRDLNCDVTGVEFDSRRVTQGSLFVALTGKNVDGHQFIQSAVSKGASAVIGTQPVIAWQQLNVPYVQVLNARTALAWAAAAFFHFPARKMIVIGVTGTDGKTTTSNLIYQILRSSGINAGMISTVNAQIGELVLDTGFHVTTPEAPDIQQYLWQMVEAGISHVVLETTSHGLDQQRVTGCEYDIGVVTNITHEHLDYHGSYQDYLESKAKLFQMVSETKPKDGRLIRLAVLNKDDQSYPLLKKLVTTQTINYSLSSGADLWAENITHQGNRTHFIVCSDSFRLGVEIPLPGDFNVANCLAALAVTVLGLGINPHVAVDALKTLPSVPGRMEVIDLGQPFLAIVDFAHTPNALDNALSTARSMTHGNIIAVFGSAGLRDRMKRRMMAAVSVSLADISIFTAEDPRTESLDAILAEMKGEAIQAGAIEGKNLFIVPDRGAAIQLAVDLANENDLVIACGKGHEQSMCFGEIEYPWDDRLALMAALSSRLGLDGPSMPYLPTTK